MSGNMRRSQNPFDGVPHAAMNPGLAYPIQQHFSAPSTHFINVFSTPGDYGVTYQFNPVNRGSGPPAPPALPAARHAPIDQGSLSPSAHIPIYSPPPATRMPTFANGGPKQLSPQSPPIPTHRTSPRLGANGSFNLSQ